MNIYTVCTESRVVVPSAWRIPTIVCLSVLAFAVVLTTVLWPLRNDIRLAVKQRQRTPPSSEGNDAYSSLITRHVNVINLSAVSLLPAVERNELDKMLSR